MIYVPSESWLDSMEGRGSPRVPFQGAVQLMSPATPSLLLVDDDRLLLESMAQWLHEKGLEVVPADSYQRAVEALAARHFDLLLCDIRLPEKDGFELLAHCRSQSPATTCILMTGYGTVETGIEALRAGAFDLLTKPLIDEELWMALERALSQRQVLEENRRLKEQLDERFGLDQVISADHRMKRIFEIIDSVADTRTTVLITGESGTGKSLLARALHRRSSRRDGPFISVACGALPESLLESELFGHVAGAFTGAVSDKRGKFELADGGTIFLDEIGTASPSMQVKLLRVLQEYEFEPVGGHETRKVDVRVILATNENLEQAVAEGRFREDLYYRINVISIELPPLRERIGDIPLLAKHFLQQVVEETGKPVESISDEAMTLLQRHHWPGNVRELQNTIERSVLLGKGPILVVEDLPPALRSGYVPSSKPLGQRTLREALEGPERQIILEVLEACNWNRNLTATTLGINRTTLYKKMKRLGIDDRSTSGSPS